MNPIFNETEKTSIATVILKMIAADKTFDRRELRFLQDMYLQYDIPLIISNRGEVCYNDSVECIRLMSPDKKAIVHDILYGLAECDEALDERERMMIENILK